MENVLRMGLFSRKTKEKTEVQQAVASDKLNLLDAVPGVTFERSHHLIHFREFEVGDSCFFEICVSPRGLRLTFSPQALIPVRPTVLSGIPDL